MNYYKEIKNELINNEITKKIKDYIWLEYDNVLSVSIWLCLKNNVEYITWWWIWERLN